MVSQFHEDDYATDPYLHPAHGVITSVLAATQEVNGGELESVLTMYRPEGLAVLVLNALHKRGWVLVRKEEQ